MNSVRKSFFSLLLIVVVLAGTPPSSAAPGMGTLPGGHGIKIVRSDATGLILDLEIPSYAIVPKVIAGKSYQVIDFPGVIYSTQPGYPQLPVVNALMGIPPDAQVEMKVVAGEASVVSTPVHLPPVPVPEALKNDLQPGTQVYQEKTDLTDSDALYPHVTAFLDGEAWLRDQRIMRLSLYPFQYSPMTGNLYWHKSLRVQINFIRDGSQPSAVFPGAANQNPFESALSQNLLNYDQARYWRANPVASNERSTPLKPVDTGTRFKIAVDRDGIYKLSYSNLQAAGVDVANLDPTTFRLTSQGSEVAITVFDNNNNPHQFWPGEYILFYGQKFSGERMASRFTADDDLWMQFTTQLPNGTYSTWQPQMNAAMLEKYTDQNIYWLSYGENPGARMDVVSGAPGVAPISSAYTDTVRAEQSHAWKTTLFTSEDTWFWERLVTTGSLVHTYTTTISAPVIDSTLATLRGEVVSESYNDAASPDHHITVYFNDPSYSQALLDATWDGKSRYRFETTILQSSLVNGTNQLHIQYSNTPAVPADTLFFDWFEVQYRRQYQAVDNQISFSSEQSGDWKYEVDGFTTPNPTVLKITQPLTPTLVSNAVYASGRLTFQASQGAASRYIVAAPQDLPADRILKYTPPDLSTPADYLLITHASFSSGAQTLANYHNSRGLTARVVDVADLYNQFNDGIYHPIAIKRYLQYAFSAWSSPPAYVALIGDGHWNFKGYTGYDSPPIYMPPYLAWVDPWQGEVDSANLLAAVVGSDPLPDVVISRIPVNSAIEMNRVVNKTLGYSQAPVADWQRNFVFGADNTPDPAGEFVTVTENLIADYITPGWVASRIYLDNYECASVAPYDCPPATDDLINTLNITGSLIVNYTGHAGINFWASEQLLSNADIPYLTNGNRLPVILSMDCLDGYWSHPNLTVASKSGPGLIEEVVRADQRGAVAAFSPTGLGVSTGHDSLHRGFYDALFRNGEWRLGPATVAAKVALYNTSSNADLIHTFTLFGDPALEMPSPFDISAAPLLPTQSAAPGASVYYSVNITNTGTLTDTAMIQVEQATWQVSAPLTVSPLPPGGTAEFQVRVDIPSLAADNDTDTAILSVTSQGDRRKSASSTMTTVAHPFGVTVNPISAQQFGMPGSVIVYPLEVTNVGGFTDSYVLTVSGQAWATVPSTIHLGPLDPGEKSTVMVEVTIPDRVVFEAVDQAVVQISSQNDPTKSAQSSLQSRVVQLFFPHLSR